MQLRILNSCKNRIKHYTNKKKGQEAFKQHKKDSGRIREMRLGRVGSCRHLRGRIALQAKLSLLPAMGTVIFNYDTASLGYPGETRTGNIYRRSGNRCGVGGGRRLRVGKRGSKRAEAKKTAFSGFLPPRVITFWNFQTWAKHKKAYFCSGQADKRLHSPFTTPAIRQISIISFNDRETGHRHGRTGRFNRPPQPATPYSVRLTT